MQRLFLVLLLAGCAGAGQYSMPDDFQYVPIQTDYYEIATWQKITNPNGNYIHIYIEGDGHSFDAYGRPTNDPTPRGTFVRDLAGIDYFENVVYVARPCQFIMDKNCSQTDWTTGRFSQKVIDSESQVINKIAKNKNVILTGYSGGGMVSGLVIKQNPKLKVRKWITVAGVLNHTKWTNYFGDKPLTESLDMDTLPKVPQEHFVGGRDRVVPYELAKTWADEQDIRLLPNASHDDFKHLKLFD
jgi:hypothetical protein